MRYQDIVAIYARNNEADRACQREYRLSDQYAVMVDFVAFPPDPVPQVRLSVATYRAGEDFGAGFVLLGDLTPQEIVKVSEIKAMVDAWVRGDTDAMPPSTSTEVRTAWARLPSCGLLPGQPAPAEFAIPPA